MLEDDSDSENNKARLEELLEEKALPYEDTYLKAEEEAKKEVLNDRLKRLKKCYVFEKTPLGNVAMCYNFDKDSFEYYSDSYAGFQIEHNFEKKLINLIFFNDAAHCRLLSVNQHCHSSLTTSIHEQNYAN